ncbi:ABC transporter substrate-binding protein [Sphingomonas piscis]|uniref:ABC transporter substrate-binding protein n=1 Tax=Sphingomonas piscis TaxID=2714943 RepID=A0A6G7YQH8_9SPHN|nr:galactofuranose ABC transporter, galactofuranose-binding protein YtfQ [Sphingomonas piscis]QIK78993.1 ABC transporter substrate-binding protein [Sphingomonas piscis]
MKRIGLAVAVAALALGGCGKQGGGNGGMTVGFAQIGSESGWRTAETNAAKASAKEKGVDLRISDAQQRQENQIKAIRAFIAQGVDGILLAPVVATGWDQVLKEAQAAKIPVVLVDRLIETSDKNLYLSAVTSDQVLEGRTAGEWLTKTVGSRDCPVIELQGTVGSSPAIARKKGFDEALAKTANVKIVRSQSGDFTRSKAKEVMESAIKAVGGNKICAVYAHNDDMMIGAIQAMKEAGLRPGKDVLTVSIDGVPDIFKAMQDGEANATVELTPDMAGPALDMLAAYKKDGKAPPKWHQTPTKLYLPDTAAAEYQRRKDLY